MYATVRRARPAAGPADGRWYWQARYWSDVVTEAHPAPGERTVWTGWATRDEVEVALRDLGDPAAAELAATVATPAPVAPETVATLLKRWKASTEARADLSVFTVRNYGTRLVQLKAGLGEVQLDRLDRLTLERYRDRRLREGCATATLNKEFTVLGAAWAWGREVGAAPDRSLPRLRVEETPVRNRRTPTPADLAAVLAKMSGWPRMAVFLLCSTGCRIGEVATLERTAVEIDAGEIRVNGKTGERPVLLPDHAIDELRAWLAASERPNVLGVSPNVVRGHLWKFIAEACAEAKVPRFSPQGMRRAAVGAFMRAGVEVAVAAEHLGHSPAVMLKLYRDVTPEDRRAGVKRAALGSLPSAPAG